MLNLPKVDYEERQQEKKEAYQKLSKKHLQEADQREKQSKSLADCLNGQPILVGHHSENRTRKAYEKIRSDRNKAHEHRETAEHYNNKIQNIESSYAISQDDPEAITKLKLKFNSIVKEIEEVKEHNKINKQFVLLSALGHREDFKEIHNTNGTYKTYAKIIKGKLEFTVKNIPEDLKKIIVKYHKTGKLEQPELKKENICHAPYVLQNLNANKNSVKKRIEHLEQLDKVKDQSWENNNIKLEINKDQNRIMLFFPGKPDQEIRTNLKRHGFRWSPRNSAWQSYINGHNLDFAKKEILKID